MGLLRADVLAALDDAHRSCEPVVFQFELDPTVPLRRLLHVVSAFAVNEAVTDLRPASLDPTGSDRT